jgi:hypothetical protein
MGKNPVNHSKPGSNQDQILQLYPKSFCYRADLGERERYAVRISRKSRMILGTGLTAEKAWKNAIDNYRNDH